MAHHITLNSLILDFKRANEGSNIAASALLTILAPAVAAYVAPLPHGAAYEGEATYNAAAKKFIVSLLSDCSELLMYDTNHAMEIARTAYVNRYNVAFSGEMALEAVSLSDIIKVVAGDVVEISNLTIWYNRFYDVFKKYYTEMIEKESRDADSI